MTEPPLPFDDPTSPLTAPTKDQYKDYHHSNLLYSEESLFNYVPGGFHPVKLGDTFKDSRYKVHHKLGWGRFSTAWLAHDKERNEWVSLKILAANQAEHEQHHLKLLNEKPGSSKHMVQLLDSFHHEGPNGVHQCLVLELLGPTIDHALAEYTDDGDGMLNTKDVFRLTGQLLEAVRFIHHDGYSHGDIKQYNVVLTCSNLSKASEEECLDFIGRPHVEKLKRVDDRPLAKGLPTHLIKSAEWVNWRALETEEIRLLDFGDCFWQGTPLPVKYQPRQFRTPELIFDSGFDERADLWRAGCMVYWITLAVCPFEYSHDVQLVFQMINFSEPFPEEWRQKWEYMKHSLGPEWVDESDCAPRMLKKAFFDKARDPALAPLLTIIQGLMRYFPEKRITTDRALSILSGTECTDESEPML